MLRICSLGALVVLVAAGCGGSARPQQLASRGVPRVLAREWASRASAVADAAKVGNSCRALQLASSLRDDVIAAKGKVPARLRRPLLSGVTALADRFTCTPTVKAPPPKHPKPPHDHKHHDHGNENGNGNGQ
jgi:hypothetical protein